MDGLNLSVQQPFGFTDRVERIAVPSGLQVVQLPAGKELPAQAVKRPHGATQQGGKLGTGELGPSSAVHWVLFTSHRPKGMNVRV